MPYPNYFLSYYPKLWSEFVDICTERFWIQCPTVLLISRFHLKMWVMSFLQSNSFEKKQVSTSLHLQSATPDYQTFLRLLTLPWTGTPAVIESGLAPVSQHPITTRRAKSQQSTSPNFVPCSTPGGVGTSRKVPVPDRLILFTERRHVGGEEKHKCRYCRPQICKL